MKSPLSTIPTQSRSPTSPPPPASASVLMFRQCSATPVLPLLHLLHALIVQVSQSIIHVYINFAAPVSSPTILEAALVQGPDEDNQTSLLLLNLKNSTFPKEAASTCHIRVTSSASLIQMPCQELLLVSLPPGNLCNNMIIIMMIINNNKSKYNKPSIQTTKRW